MTCSHCGKDMTLVATLTQLCKQGSVQDAQQRLKTALGHTGLSTAWFAGFSGSESTEGGSNEEAVPMRTEAAGAEHEQCVVSKI